MTPVIQSDTNVVIRPVQYRDLEAVERLLIEAFTLEDGHRSTNLSQQLQRIRRWYGPLKLLSLFPNRFQHLFRTHVAAQANQIKGVIQVSPFNRTRRTWRVDHVAVSGVGGQEIGSELLRYCFEKILEARTWLLEVNVNDQAALGLYRQNGFQPLAQITYWAIAPEQLQAIAARELDLPNLLPISNADASLLYQLDTAAMPPLVRQVFDREILDFKAGLFSSLTEGVRRRISKTELTSGYVFEPQRKAAIGCFQIRLCQDGTQPHTAQLTVHPAYTWLYPELLTQMAQLAQSCSPQSLQLTSADYQPEREEYLEQLGATRVEHTLMMSRSVWHKLRESKPISLEGLQLSEVLQGFQPNRKPVPGRISLQKPGKQQRESSQPDFRSTLNSGVNELVFEQSIGEAPLKCSHNKRSDHDGS
jgi:ribosomal protein S18 acetylase RimI-like enzyme